MVYYISYSCFPDGGASSVRSVNVAKIFISCGLDVTLIGMGDSECFQVIKGDDFSYVSLRIKGRDIISRLRSHSGFKRRLKTFLDQKNDIDAIVLNLNTLPLNPLQYIKKLAKRKGVKLFLDCCEWYSPEQFRMGKMSLGYLQNSYCVQKYVDTDTYPISISKYFASYFTNKGIRTFNIPVVMDMDKTKCIKNGKSDNLILMYAGYVGKKDYLHIMLKGLSMLNPKDLANVEFRIFGAKLSDVKENIDSEVFDKVNNSIKCYGRVERQVVLKNLEDADFTVLMRSAAQRYAKAGFPTKVVESLASATPVICNLTSDLGDFIIDGNNGVVVNDEDAESFSRAIKKALSFSVSEKKAMSKNARITAENKFDYKLYKDKIMELIDLA